MAHAIRISEIGAADVMQWVEVPQAAPAKGEALIRHTVIGVNFTDIYFRTGVYPIALPAVLGSEGAGIVEAIGPEVSEVAVGDRVAYIDPMGSYSERRVIPAARLVRIPAAISDKAAAAALLKGMTAYYLLFRTFKVARGDNVLVHAAAGGVGSLLGQWGAALGATMIGTVGSDSKLAVARQNGYRHAINYRQEDFVQRTRTLTGGDGVDVVYDSVGKDTFPGSLDSLKRMGMWVSFGQSSGVPPPFATSMLQQKGSLFATRPTTVHYYAKRGDLVDGANATFKALADGVIKVAVSREFPLREAATAHRALESRTTIGSVVLFP
jgi:NADPH2:quinone reductase